MSSAKVETYCKNYDTKKNKMAAKEKKKEEDQSWFKDRLRELMKTKEEVKLTFRGGESESGYIRHIGNDYLTLCYDLDPEEEEYPPTYIKLDDIGQAHLYY